MPEGHMVHGYRLPLFAALLWPASGLAPLAGQATVAGVVVEAATRQPIANALVLLDTTRQVTAVDGRFRFAGVATGSRILRVSHIAYAERHDTIDVRDGDVIDLQIPIAVEPIRLAPLNVDVRSQRLLDVGFYDRVERGNGIYIHPSQLRETRAAHLSDFLARIPGVRRTTLSGETSRIDMRGGRSISLPCETQYFLDGAAVATGIAIIENLMPNNVAGIEVYRGASETPIQFDNGRASCGAIVIWTRRN
jgi:hypothetical protein